MPVSDAKEMILRTSAKELLKHRPSWLKDCVRISVSAQDITTGEILYRRTINIRLRRSEHLLYGIHGAVGWFDSGDLTQY